MPQQNNSVLKDRTPPPDFIPDVGGSRGPDFIPDRPSEADAVAALPNAGQQSKQQLQDRVTATMPQTQGEFNRNQEAGIERGMERERAAGRYPLTDMDTAMMGMGAVGAGKQIAEKGIVGAAKPLIKGAIGAAGGSAAGRYGGGAIGQAVGGDKGKQVGEQIGATVGGFGGGIYGGMQREPVPEPEMSKVSQGPGPYTGPVSARLAARTAARVPGPVPSGATLSSSPGLTPFTLPPPGGEGTSTGMPPGMPVESPQMPLAARTGQGITGGAQQPFEPLVYADPYEAAQGDFRAANLQRQASRAGLYSAAQGKTGQPLNYQQRIGAEAGTAPPLMDQYPPPRSITPAPSPSPSLEGRIPPPDNPTLSQRTGIRAGGGVQSEGESRMEQLRRGASGESPTVKSVKRHYKKENQ
jgi:hypothetical protein